MSDEARLLSPEEARLKRKVREIAEKDKPKPFVKIRANFEPDLQKRARRRQLPRRYSGEIGTKIRGEVHSKAGVSLKYDPAVKEIKVGEVFPIDVRGKAVEDPFKPFREQHAEVRNTVLPRAAVKDAVKKVATGFPKANWLVGERMTGMRTKEGIDVIQKFNLGSIRKRLSKSGKAGKALGLGLAAYEAYKGAE